LIHKKRIVVGKGFLRQRGFLHPKGGQSCNSLNSLNGLNSLNSLNSPNGPRRAA
jgi:hypothetical protein